MAATKVLLVAEKPKIAKAIASILSRQSSQVSPARILAPAPPGLRLNRKCGITSSCSSNPAIVSVMTAQQSFTVRLPPEPLRGLGALQTAFGASGGPS